VIALDEQLRIAEHADKDARRAAPDASAAVQIIPIHDVADAAVGLFVEAALGRFHEPVVAGAYGGVAPAEHNGVQIEPMMKLAHREDVDPAANETVDQHVAIEHILEHFVIERVAPIGQLFVDLRKCALKPAK